MKLISKNPLNIKKIEEKTKEENNKIINEDNSSLYLEKVKKDEISEEVVNDFALEQISKSLSNEQVQTKIIDIITKNQTFLNSLTDNLKQSFSIKIEKK